jgi:hypothetical protein
MKSVVFVIPVLMTLGAAELEAQAARIQGAWRPDQVVYTGPNARTVSSPQPGMYIFGARHYARVEVTSDGPRPAPADYATATADELRAVWNPFGSNAGTYEVSGSEVTVRPIVAKNPEVMAPDFFAVFAFRIQGDTLWLTGQRNVGGPVQNPTTVRYRRLE